MEVLQKLFDEEQPLMLIDLRKAQRFVFPKENASASNQINQAIMQDLVSVGGRDQFRKMIKCIH